MRRIALLLVFAGCAEPVGRAPSPPAAMDRDYQIALNWHQDPGEIVACHYFKAPNDVAAEINRVTVNFPTGSHHVHLYHTTLDVPDGVEDCSTTGIDWTKWSFLVGVQTQPIDWEFPTGVTLPLAAHEQLLVQVHWINATLDPIDREIDITLHATKPGTEHLGVAFGVSKDTGMPAGASKSVAGWVPIPSGARVAAIMGHFHGRGRHYQVDMRKRGDGPGQKIYEAADEQTFEFERYTDQPQLTDGVGLAYQCDFTNDLPFPLTWGPDTKRQEHCNLAAYYHPAGPDDNPIVVGDVVGLDVTRAPTLAGDPAKCILTLSAPAGPAGVDVTVTGDGLTMPATVHVPAWTDRAGFEVSGLRPTRGAAVHITTGSTVLDGAVPVSGLALSEVFASAGAGAQWVELQNLTNLPIDLSRYSLGAGGPSWLSTRVSLGGGTLPPSGCLVVGGPDGLPLGGAAQIVSELISPALDGGGVVPAGVALFDAPMGQVADATVPLDALQWGSGRSPLIGSDGQPGVPMAPAALGSSLERTDHWQPQPAPTPGICRVSRASN
jgi:hypothetical protein